MHVTITLNFPSPVTLQTLNYILSDLMGYVEESASLTFSHQSVIFDGYTETETQEEAENALDDFEDELLIQAKHAWIDYRFHDEENPS